jgi:hypothetical protein
MTSLSASKIASDPAEILNDVLMEPVPAVRSEKTITEALRSLWDDPQRFVRHWNYKGAILSGVLRAPIFLITYLIRKEALWLAVGAAMLQFAFRFVFAGIGGTLIQSFRFVEPPWKALVAVLCMVPLVSHLIEFALQISFGHITGTRDITGDAVMRSICVSVISALFTLFAMRRGIMIVGETESKSLISDIGRLPIVIFHFIAFIPNELSYMLRRGAFVGVALGVALFGVFSELLIWAVTNKWYWTYGGGKDLGWLKYWGIDGIILLVMAVIIASIVNSPRHQPA